jgi:glycine dehydrogenase subunit 2
MTNELPKLRNYHAASWDEPLVLTMGRPGRRGLMFPRAEAGVQEVVGDLAGLLPAALRRPEPPRLPELSDPDVLRHYLHLSQETLGTTGISLFGTCTVKHHPSLNEQIIARPEVAQIHPHQDERTVQGTLAIVHGLDRMLCELSGMDRFVFQAGGGAHAAYTHAAMTRAYHAARGELEQRDQIIVTIQTHPCNAATAAAAGFEVVTLALGENGYVPVEALRAAVSSRTAAIMVNNPDDMGIYDPNIKEWIEIAHAAGALCFYDHANFNGVMGKIRARELGFDACMFMLHKTFGATKGGGPAVGAYGCSAELEPFLPAPVVTHDADGYHLDYDRPQSLGKVREFWGNVPQVIKAYAWLRSMGIEGIHEARDLSVLHNNYMTKVLLARARGISVSNPTVTAHRMEMTRFSFGQLYEDTGVDVHDISNRMTDFGIDAPWLSHEPWLVPEPITPEAGEMYSKEDLDYWMAVLVHVCEEAYSDPELVKSAPHNHPVAHPHVETAEEPDTWAMTLRAQERKHPSTIGSRG